MQLEAIGLGFESSECPAAVILEDVARYPIEDVEALLMVVWVMGRRGRVGVHEGGRG